MPTESSARLRVEMLMDIDGCCSFVPCGEVFLFAIFVTYASVCVCVQMSMLGNVKCVCMGPRLWQGKVCHGATVLYCSPLQVRDGKTGKSVCLHPRHASYTIL